MTEKPIESQNGLFRKKTKGPIFIVGNGRSGTSVMLSSVRKTLDWKFHGEGHFYGLIKDLHVASDNFYQSDKVKNLSVNPAHMIHHVDGDLMNVFLAKMTRDVFFHVYGSSRFVDKTPGPAAILSLPFLQQAFPTMRVIHMKRRGVEVVRSSMKKFATTSFELHCTIWEQALANWEVVKPSLRVPHITIDQNDLASNPSKEVEKLTEFLSLTSRQSKKMLHYFKSDRPQSSGDLNKGGVSIASSGWTAEQVEIYRKIAGPMMTRHGWSETEAYNS